jgi:S1-C subfamily serine protease
MDQEHGDGANDPEAGSPEPTNVPPTSPSGMSEAPESFGPPAAAEPPTVPSAPVWQTAPPGAETNEPPAYGSETPAYGSEAQTAASTPPPEPAPSWAWSTEAPPASGATVPAAAGTATKTKRNGGIRSALVGGVAGALVGALIAGGIVAATDNNDSTPQAVNAVSATTEEPARPATQLVQPGDIRSILSAARPAVVRIDVGNNGQTQATGTGFIVDSSGVIVTNNHVVEGFNTVTVHTAAGDEMQGKVVGADATLDLAVVKVDKSGLPTLQLGDSDTLQVGDGVVAIGNALGLSEGSGATVTTGIISGLDRVVEVGNETLFNAIQTDAAINPGNSGGPLVDMNGRVIGINTAIASPDTSNNVGFAISISSAKPVIDALREGKKPTIAFLGVTSEPLTPGTAKQLGVSQGAVVADVASGSGAAKAGIKNGDVIVEIDGAKVTSVEGVAGEVRKHNPGDQIDVVIVRNGQKQTVTVTLSDRPQNS